jgi:hypothetical protein
LCEEYRSWSSSLWSFLHETLVKKANIGRIYRNYCSKMSPKFYSGLKIRKDTLNVVLLHLKRLV